MAFKIQKDKQSAASASAFLQGAVDKVMGISRVDNVANPDSARNKQIRQGKIDTEAQKFMGDLQSGSTSKRKKMLRTY